MGPHVRAVADAGLPAWVLEELRINTTDGVKEIFPDLVVWRAIVNKFAGKGLTDNELSVGFAQQVRIATREAGFDAGDLETADDIETRQLVAERAPEFIRAADHLSPREQLELLELPEQVSVEHVEHAERAQRETIEALRVRREGSGGDGPGASSGNVLVVFQHALTKLVRQQQHSEVDRLLDDPEGLVVAMAQELAKFGPPDQLGTLQELLVILLANGLKVSDPQFVALVASIVLEDKATALSRLAATLAMADPGSQVAAPTVSSKSKIPAAPQGPRRRKRRNDQLATATASDDMFDDPLNCQ